MRDRLLLHEKLVGILGSRNVYFQPPVNIKLSYPCIVYKRNVIDAEYADNSKFMKSQSYQVTLIYSDPDSTLPEKLFTSLDFCSANTPTYVADNLYHDVFTVYW